AASVRPEPGSNSPIKRVSLSSLEPSFLNEAPSGITFVALAKTLPRPRTAGRRYAPYQGITDTLPGFSNNEPTAIPPVGQDPKSREAGSDRQPRLTGTEPRQPRDQSPHRCGGARHVRRACSPHSSSSSRSSSHSSSSSHS